MQDLKVISVCCHIDVSRLYVGEYAMVYLKSKLFLMVSSQHFGYKCYVNVGDRVEALVA
jgi:hypothetical protein